MAYTTEHKIFLQTLMHRGLLDENKAKDIVIKLFSKLAFRRYFYLSLFHVHTLKQKLHISDNDRTSMIVNQINEQLQPLNMLIKKAQCEITGQAYWVLVSTIMDDVTRYMFLTLLALRHATYIVLSVPQPLFKVPRRILKGAVGFAEEYIF